MLRRVIRPGRLSRFSTATVTLCLQRYPGTDNGNSGISFVEYRFKVNGRVVHTGITGNNGMIRVRFDPTQRATIDMLGTEYQLSVRASIEPINTREGVQRRLSALGYELGTVDGVIGRHTDRAILQFQADNGLNPDGVVGARTRQGLRRRFGE
ncbi:MAG: hypothetical protein BMS9Abin05_2151 [Rhodothermia bacterium]|nr:MAG: hypothetical protein BMS9Abin05_2151 [Rhodothermia bacterium]